MFSLGAWETPFDVCRHHFLQSICEKNTNLLKLPKQFYFHFSMYVFSLFTKNMHLPSLICALFLQTHKHICLRTSRREKLFSTPHHHLPPSSPNAWNSTFSFKYKTASHQHDWTWHKRVGLTPRTPPASTCVCVGKSGTIAADHSLPHCRSSPAGLSSDGESGSESFGGRARTHANGSLHTK